MPKASHLLGELVVGVQRQSDSQAAREIEEKRLALVDRWRRDPWAWLAGRDTDGRPIIWTKDEKLRQIRPFPHYPYLRELVKRLQNEHRLLLDKARQMLASLTILLFDDWDSAWHPVVNTVVSKHKREEAEALFRDKIRFPYSQMPGWLRLLRPITKKPKHLIEYTGTGSLTLAAAENIAVADARGITATRAIIDEAAYQATLEDMLQALEPMDCQIIALTSPNLGNPGATTFYRLLERDSA